MDLMTPRLRTVTAAGLLAFSACGEPAPEGGQTETTSGAPADSLAAPEVSAAPVGAAVSSVGFLDPNGASREDLLMVPGISPPLADAIVAGRRYADMRGVDRVLTGQLSEEQRDSVYTRLWKPFDLNAATPEEIELIPGVGPKMRHEFEEYRPYRNVEQFRREIGKYVDDAEVARLERYVTLP